MYEYKNTDCSGSDYYFCVVLDYQYGETAETGVAVRFGLAGGGCRDFGFGLFPYADYNGWRSWLGMASPPNMLVFLRLPYLLLTIIFILTVAVSRMSIRIKNLAQQVAFLEKKVRDREDAGEE